MQARNDDDAWQRQGNDLLLMEFPVSLKQALCGEELHVRHLDGRVVVIKRPDGAMLKPSEWIRVPGEGMPIMGRPYAKGNLYIKVTVTMPEDLSADTLAQIGRLLPDTGESEMMDTEEADDAKLEPVGSAETLQEELQMRMRAFRQQASAYDSDEDDGPGGGNQRVQCAQS